MGLELLGKFGGFFCGAGKKLQKAFDCIRSYLITWGQLPKIGPSFSSNARIPEPKKFPSALFDFFNRRVCVMKRLALTAKTKSWGVAHTTFGNLAVFVVRKRTVDLDCVQLPACVRKVFLMRQFPGIKHPRQGAYVHPRDPNPDFAHALTCAIITPRTIIVSCPIRDTRNLRDPKKKKPGNRNSVASNMRFVAWAEPRGRLAAIFSTKRSRVLISAAAAERSFLVRTRNSIREPVGRVFTMFLKTQNIKAITDDSYGMTRTEVLCANCDAHFGTCFRRRPEADRNALLH